MAAQRPHRSGDVVGDRREVHLGETRVVALLAGQLVALHREGLVEHRPHLVEGAAEVAAAAGGLAQAADPVGEVVEPPTTVEPAPHELAEGLAQAAAGHDVSADLVEGRAHVEGRRQRVGPAGPRGVAEPPVRVTRVAGSHPPTTPTGPTPQHTE